MSLLHRRIFQPVLPTPFEQKSALAQKIGKIGKLNNFQNLLKYLLLYKF